jgi:hypothetical protein
LFAIGLILAGLTLTRQGAYTDPRYLTSFAFEDSSHWVQPWRSTLETVPVAQFLDGIGVDLDLPDKADPDLICRMLGTHGVRNTRIEVPWAKLDYATEQIQDSARATLTRRLLACKHARIRPLILLNGNSGAPCPILFFKKRLTISARKGDRTLQVDDPSGLRVGYSGVNNLTEYWAAEALITGISGKTLMLSKPLPKDLGTAGSEVSMSTLRYRPFGVPGTTEFQETLGGWKRYVDQVSRLVDSVMRTSSDNPRYDLEIWNELSFGSWFLVQRDYYEPKLPEAREADVWGAIVKATAEVASSIPARFKGVTLCDGFSNTVPWPASSTEPAGVDVLSKHPYKGVESYPQVKRKNQLMPDLKVDKNPTWTPTYTSIFPEYFATGLQTETVLRDSSPLTTEIYGTKHGRFARPGGPVWTWFTEVGNAPNEVGVTGEQEALLLKAKTTSRYFSFYLNKGVQRLYLYAACAGDKNIGIASDAFVDFSKTSQTYPSNDLNWTSPSLAVIHRMSELMSDHVDPRLSVTRRFIVDSVTDHHNHIQFQGDGTPAHPSLYGRDVFAFLPYQVNSTRFVIPYYVMTRDVRKPLAPELFDVIVRGFHGRVGCQVVDILSGKSVPVQSRAQRDGSIQFHLSATDSPRFLIVQER